MSATVADIQAAIRRVNAAPKRPVAATVTALATAARSWLSNDFPWRARAIEQAPASTGFSPVMVGEAIDLTFGALTEHALWSLLKRELGEPGVLDGFAGTPRTRANGPTLVTHVLAGNVPVPGIVSICCGLLLKAGNLVKLARRDPVFPSLFVESVRAVDAGLADRVAILDWPRTDTAVTQAALAAAEAVIAYGDDRSVAALRQLCPPRATFLGYGNKASFALLAKEAMTAANLPALAKAAAFDVSVYDQQGCLSPHVIYVEERGELGPRQFAAALAQAMGEYELRVPRGTLTPEEAAAVMTLRSGYQFRAATDARIAVWASPKPNDWAVIYEDDPSFQPSCLNRVVYVKPTDGFPRVLEAVRRYAGLISTVGVAAAEDRAANLAEELSRLGIHRVCPIGQMQRPPLSWPHDGRPNLAALVRWTDLG